jgi:hypothetical protein
MLSGRTCIDCKEKWHRCRHARICPGDGHGGCRCVVDGKEEPSDQELGDYLTESLTDKQHFEAVLTYKKMKKRDAVDQYRQYLKEREKDVEDGDDLF